MPGCDLCRRRIELEAHGWAVVILAFELWGLVEKVVKGID
jgi:hypothetical protein